MYSMEVCVSTVSIIVGDDAENIGTTTKDSNLAY